MLLKAYVRKISKCERSAFLTIQMQIKSQRAQIQLDRELTILNHVLSLDGSSDDKILDEVMKNTDQRVVVAKDLMTIDLKTRFISTNKKTMTKIIGILNLTLDSFSDGGMYYDIESAKKHVSNG